MATVLNNSLNIKLNNEADTLRFAQTLAQCTQTGLVVYLQGDLGAGKTTLARGFIQHFGFNRVKSPTYTLVDSYQNSTIQIHHFDLYRLSDPEELDYIGIREYQGIQLIEWAELGLGAIQNADITLKISGHHNTRLLEIITHTPIGNNLAQCIDSSF